MNTSTQNILTEYRTNHNLYNDFSYVMYNLLEDMLKKGKYKYHINNRIKNVTSLSEKIKRKKIRGKQYENIKEIEDIVGIRIVFYVEADRNKFIKSMRRDFGNEVEIKKTTGPYGYSSIHAIASLGQKRSKLVEYKRFKGLKCEIQLTLILNHAWAELEHDILYKANGTVGQVNPKYYESLKIRMKKIMSQYIQRASSELESIVKEINRIKVAKK